MPSRPAADLSCHSNRAAKNRLPACCTMNENGDPSEPGARKAEDGSEDFVQLLTNSQLMLHRYIASMLGGLDDARQILQDVNLTLWRKRDEFALGTNFAVWSRKVAYWQVRAFLRDRRRDRHVFNDELLELIADRSAIGEEEADSDGDTTQEALRTCLEHLTLANRALIRERYSNGLSVQALALRHNKSDNAMRVALLRIRRVLLRCIRKAIAMT